MALRALRVVEVPVFRRRLASVEPRRGSEFGALQHRIDTERSTCLPPLPRPTSFLPLSVRVWASVPSSRLSLPCFRLNTSISLCSWPNRSLLGSPRCIVRGGERLDPQTRRGGQRTGSFGHGACQGQQSRSSHDKALARDGTGLPWCSQPG